MCYARRQRLSWARIKLSNWWYYLGSLFPVEQSSSLHGSAVILRVSISSSSRLRFLSLYLYSSLLFRKVSCFGIDSEILLFPPCPLSHRVRKSAGLPALRRAGSFYFVSSPNSSLVRCSIFKVLFIRFAKPLVSLLCPRRPQNGQLYYCIIFLYLLSIPFFLFF